MKIFLAIVKIWSENMDERHQRNEKIAHFWEAIFQKVLGVGPKNLADMCFLAPIIPTYQISNQYL